MIFLPNIIPVVAATAMWTQYIYNPRYGFFKMLFETIGLDSLARIQWTSLDMLFWSMLIAYVWGGIGWFMMIILAGAERIPVDLYESAKLDGATLLHSFFLITLPLLRDVLRVATIMWSITVINLFAFPKTFTSVGQVPKQTTTPVIYLYELAFGQGQSGQPIVGKAAAAGVSVLLMVIVISGLISRLIKQQDLEY